MCLKEKSRRKLLYQQQGLPIFQNRMYESSEEAKNCMRGDIELVEDQLTGLVYNYVFDASLMIYDSSYQNEQGVSPLFLNHLKHVSDIVLRHLGNKSIVEVGCGKGLFLEILTQYGCDITGFDPTYEGHNTKIKKEYFSQDVGVEAKGLVLRHVLEHIQDPYNFIKLLQTANGGVGRIYIEVPCFDWICSHDAWFDIFYEHVNYFRLADFYRMFDTVIESGHLFGGQYIYVVADLTTLKEPSIDFQNQVQFPENFGKSLSEKVKISSGEIAIWGGASKGVIFALYSERVGRPVKVVIDINPAKQGRYLPLTGLLVQSPDTALKNLPRGASIVVMNSNYLEEIKSMSNNQYNYIGVDHE